VERNKTKTIIILTNNPFPVGLAGTSRILSYCKGFQYHGYQPEIICIRPTEPYKNPFNTSAKGNFNSIKYSYPGGTAIRVASFWGRRFNDFTALLLSLKKLMSLIRGKKVAFVIFYGNSVFTELVSILITRLFHVKILKEESENPNVYFAERKSVIALLQKWFFINKLYRLYTGVLVMTNPLRDFFLAKGVPDKKILVVPQTVDHERFENIKNHPDMTLPDDYIAYVGSLNQQKDGVLTLVESFSTVSARYPGIHLILAGDGSQQEKEELSSLINKLHLDEKVHYVGRISSNEIPYLFHGAKILASCRPISVQSDYGFPTKIAEYLASGKPVVTTATGELTYYLKDRENAFVAEKAEKDAFSSKIMEALLDNDFAMKVAQNGKELVAEVFNPLRQTQKIIDFYIN
jgi:glycosyltransferase involved in cell wall biosynthesis